MSFSSSHCFDPGAEAMKDPRTMILDSDGRNPRGWVEYASTEKASDGTTTVDVLILGNNTLSYAGVEVSYGEDGAVNARQIPFSEGGPYTEFRLAPDGTTLPAVYHGPYGAELIG